MQATGHFHVRRNHTPTATTSCNGLSQSSRRLGDVASCELMNTRNASRQPVRPSIANHTEYSARYITTRRHWSQHTRSTSTKNTEQHTSGVALQCVGPSVASGTPYQSVRVADTSGLPSAKCAPAAF